MNRASVGAQERLHVEALAEMPADIMLQLLEIAKLGTEVEVLTKHIRWYQGELLALNPTSLTLEYFNEVKEQTREVDIPYIDILKVALFE
jgi:hypothetical protein